MALKQNQLKYLLTLCSDFTNIPNQIFKKKFKWCLRYPAQHLKIQQKSPKISNKTAHLHNFLIGIPPNWYSQNLFRENILSEKSDCWKIFSSAQIFLFVVRKKYENGIWRNRGGKTGSQWNYACSEIMGVRNLGTTCPVRYKNALIGRFDYQRVDCTIFTTIEILFFIILGESGQLVMKELFKCPRNSLKIRKQTTNMSKIFA